MPIRHIRHCFGVVMTKLLACWFIGDCSYHLQDTVSYYVAIKLGSGA